MVRLMIYLISKKECSQDIFEKKFRSAMKSFIYNKLKNSKFELDKSNSNFRGFVFSNIYSINNKKLDQDGFYKIAISSVYPELIMFLLNNINIGDNINLGEASFEIKDILIFRDNIEENIILETPSLISVRTTGDKDKYVDYEKNPQKFLEILKRNLIKKYNYFNKENIVLDFDLFKNIKIEKVIPKNRNNSFMCVEIEDFEDKKKRKIFVYGNRLRFIINKIDELQKNILQVGYDAGFGSLNSYGFGYLIIKNLKEIKND